MGFLCPRLRPFLPGIAAVLLLLGAAVLAAAGDEPTFHGLRITFSLGMGRGGNFHGKLLFAGNSPAPTMAERAMLVLVGDLDDFKAIRDAGASAK